MRTTLKGILIGVVLLVSAGRAFAYPPDNASVLYYKAFMLLEEPNDSMKQMLRNLQDGNIGLNEQIKQYVGKNRKVIEEIVTAAEIRTCDWGLDFSEGFSLKVPHLPKCRQMAYILAADARILAEERDYRTALGRCLTIHKMGGHAGNDTLIARLVGIAISGTAYARIVDILPQVSGDSQTLEWLRVRLADVSSRFPSMKEATAKETEIYGYINREDVVSCMEEPCDVPKEILQGDDVFFIKSKEYLQSVMAKMQSAFDLSYPEAYQRFKDLYKEVENSAKEKPEAIMAIWLFPAIGRAYSIEMRIKTHTNAVLAGIDIYLIRAKTGKLPEELPEGLPKDMFSGKDFLYEKTDAGFILKCQGKDQAFDTVRQFEFKIAK